MSKPRVNLGHSIYRISLLFPVILILLPLVLFLSCVGQKMSLKEAKQVSISMSGKSFIPPPRRIDDILTLLEQPDRKDPKFRDKMEKMYKSSPPKDGSDKALAKFYQTRGGAAIYLGRFNRALEDLRLAFRHADSAKYNNMHLFNMLGKLEEYFGNFKKAIELNNLNTRYFPEYPTAYRDLVVLYRGVGDLESAKKAAGDGKALYFYYFSHPRRPEQWYDLVKALEAEVEANLLESQAKYSEAELYRRAAIKHAIKFNSSLAGRMMIKQLGSSPLIVSSLRYLLSNNLMEQDRSLEAELEARQALKDAIETYGKNSAAAGVALSFLGETLMKQGKLSDAERLMRSGIRILEDSGVSSDSLLVGKIRGFLGNILMARYDFDGAMKQYDLVKENMRENQYIYNMQIAREPSIMVSLLKTGRVKEAVELISNVYDTNSQSYGKKHYMTAEILGLRGIANAMTDKRLQAIKDFSNAVPVLIGGSGGDGDNYLKRQILKIIVESYMELLTQIRGTRLEKRAGLVAAEEAFMLVDALGGQFVRGALGASSARAAVSDQDLARLIRTEQDTFKQIKVLQEALATNMAMPADQQIQGVKEDLRKKIGTLTIARATIMDEIKARFPKYADLVSPQPVTLNDVQNHLRSGEAFISIYTSENRTYIWAVPKDGETLFFPVPIDRRDMNQIVTHIRMALNPDPTTLGSIPEFDLGQAYELYSKLLKPVEEVWEDATDLIIVVQGPLGRLPLSVLPTSLVRVGLERKELFGNYRKVPWLIRKVSITMHPSVSSFITLRKLPIGDPTRKAFAGFGDPYFNQEQLIQARKEKVSQKPILASRGGNLHIRGIRVTQAGNLDSEKITSSHIGLLNRLADTAEEIRSIAKALDADLSKDIFLGENASERQVKTMDLSDRKVISFATHALVPGDLDGLDQPAIALSAPSVTGDNEDGLLTMGEILMLKLNADWVVLSACNTGAADGAGAEAVSGLGRAFFYAGTRAILVSMWPVETTSAKKLTTKLFHYQKEDKTLSRAKALQKSMLALIDDPGLKDEASGKIISSYAHPLFWAPFIIVGEGGGAQN